MEKDSIAVNNKDVLLLVGKDRESAVKIPASKFLLRFYSSEFTKRLRGRFMLNEVNELLITEFSAETMKKVVSFMVAGNLETCLLNPTVEECLNIFLVAVTFNIKPLQINCLKVPYNRKISIDNFWNFLSLHETIVKFLAHEIATANLFWVKIVDFLQEHSAILICHAEFIKLDYEMALRFVSLCQNIDPSVMFDRVLVWARAECYRKGKEVNPKTLRKMISKIKFYISFERLSLNEFLEGPVASEILTEDECKWFSKLQIDQKELCIPWNHTALIEVAMPERNKRSPVVLWNKLRSKTFKVEECKEVVVNSLQSSLKAVRRSKIWRKRRNSL